MSKLIPSVRSAAFSTIKVLLTDSSGTSLIEFAIMLPVLLLIYAGMVNVCDALTLQRQVTTATRALADLTTQGSTYTAATLDSSVFSGAQLVVNSRYSKTNETMTIAEFYTPSNGVTNIVWSRDWNGSSSKLSTTLPINNSGGTAINYYSQFPTVFTQTGSYFIIAETTYLYTPIFGLGPMSGGLSSLGNQGFTISDVIYMGPRTSTSIPCTPPPNTSYSGCVSTSGT